MKDAKKYLRPLVVGSLVVVGTTLLSGVVSGVEMLAFEIIPGMLSAGGALAAGVSAFAADYVVDMLKLK